LIGSYVNSSLVMDSANTSSGSSFPVSFLSCILNSFIACSLLLLIHCVSLTCAAISFFITSGLSFKCSGLTNFPSVGQRSHHKYSTISFFYQSRGPRFWYPCPINILFKNSVNMSALATGVTVTFPPFSVVLNPLFCKYFLKATSCVLPS
jgi:hypothetical protein